MHAFEDILVYASLEDEDFLGLEQAAALARVDRASLTVMGVLDVPTLNGPLGLRGDQTERLCALLEEGQRERIEARARPLRDEGLDVRVEVRWGTPWLELIRAVLENGHDLVVKAAEGATRSRGPFFGSTALHLIRKCPCPVWAVSHPDDARSRKVLAAIDPVEDTTRSALARRILNLATSMAGDGGAVHALSAWRLAGETLLRNRVSPETLAEYVTDARKEARAGLEAALRKEGDPVDSDRVHLVKGEPRTVLPEFANREEFDLIVLGSLGRVGIAGLLIGETAETLIRSTRSSVLVVKPPGFECPVEPARPSR